MNQKNEIIVLYKDKDNYHEVLLNEIELGKVAALISDIFWAKKSNVIVSETKLKILEEVNANGKENNR